MQELDTRLSKIVDEARDQPVAVTRYNAPWVWIVSHNVWVDIEKLKSVVPEGHPLAEVRTSSYAGEFLIAEPTLCAWQNNNSNP